MRIAGRRNYSDKWIEGAEPVRTTNIRDHANSDQHFHAMNLHKRDMAKASGQSAILYAPIACALNLYQIQPLDFGRRDDQIRVNERSIASSTCSSSSTLDTTLTTTSDTECDIEPEPTFWMTGMR